MNKALFLDRDGIINIDHGYIYKSSQFEFVDGIFDVCNHAQNLGMQIIVITNQSGIGRGMYQEEDFLKLTEWMNKEFLKRKIVITDVFFCPHHPTKASNHYKVQCDCRKPAPGMILQAAKKHNIDLQQSIFIGDKTSDIQAAEAAGIEDRVLLNGKYAESDAIKGYRIDQIRDAIQYIR